MKNLFGRYLMMSLMLILISFSLFGVLFIWQSYNYTMGELRISVSEDAQHISEMTTMFLENRNNLLARTMFFSGINAVIYDNDEHVLICEKTGFIAFYAHKDQYVTGFDDWMPIDIIEKVLKNGEYSETGTLGGSYTSVCYTVGRPVLNSSGEAIGIVFVSTPTVAARDKFEYYQQIFIIIGIVILVISTFVSYLMARNMSLPLRIMSRATRSYAIGDFSVRIPEDRTDEIGELAHSLNQMSASLGKLEELRSSFIANVSHELKTPMTTIAGFADGILDGTIPPEREREYLRIISNDTRRLSRLVVRMLEASRLSSGEIKLHPTVFDICEMVRLNILEFESRINEKRISVDIYFDRDDISVYADQDNIAQVIYNLLDNACKYGNEEGILRIEIISQGDKVRVAVANTGDVIPPDKLPYVFDRFYKSDQSRGVDANSMGLGLFIVKSIINMHGEEIIVQSENGVTTFNFNLPAAPENKNSHTIRRIE